jgi:Leucine-rich repeat (LRR) protein
MTSNRLTAIPEEIGILKKLTELELNNNVIETLPASIGKLQALKKLSLSNNVLNKLPQELFELKNLEELSLMNCQLEALPEQISQLTKLKNFEIEGNLFTALPESIVNLTKLENLSLPDYVFTLSSEQNDWLRELYSKSNNLFSRLPYPPSSYMSISERIYAESEGNIIPEVDDEVLDILIAWANDNNLDELEWREPFSDDTDGSWSGFPRNKELLVRLRELKLLGAKCEVIPKEIAYLTNLVAVNFGENDLTSLPEEIVNLTNLSFINLSRNSNLKLTTQQMEWLNTLKDKGATVWVSSED